MAATKLEDKMKSIRSLKMIGALILLVVALCQSAFGQSWQPITNKAPFTAGVPLLLTDGSVMVQNFGTAAWWKLTPDASGSYVNNGQQLDGGRRAHRDESQQPESEK